MSKKKQKKKSSSEYIEWNDLKVGDFIESNDAYLFCFAREASIVQGVSLPSCLGRLKTTHEKISGTWLLVGKNKRLKPSKKFVKLCRELLEENFKDGTVKNLDYVEALTAIKRHETK